MPSSPAPQARARCAWWTCIAGATMPRTVQVFFFLMKRRPPRSTLFPTRRSSDRLGLRPAVVQHQRAHREQVRQVRHRRPPPDRKSTRLNSSHTVISYAVFCLKKKKTNINIQTIKKKNKRKRVKDL